MEKNYLIMVTSDFKTMLRGIGCTDNQIDIIVRYISTETTRINSDTIQYPDGSQYFSEGYVSEMITRSKSEGVSEGRREPVEHIARTVISPCPECNYQHERN